MCCVCIILSKKNWFKRELGEFVGIKLCRKCGIKQKKIPFEKPYEDEWYWHKGTLECPKCGNKEPWDEIKGVAGV